MNAERAHPGQAGTSVATRRRSGGPDAVRGRAGDRGPEVAAAYTKRGVSFLAARTTTPTQPNAR